MLHIHSFIHSFNKHSLILKVHALGSKETAENKREDIPWSRHPWGENRQIDRYKCYRGERNRTRAPGREALLSMVSRKGSLVR
jgi:hypothetical protein